jgi:urease accessory protein
LSWHARLELSARRDDAGRCTVHSKHEGPLRVLKTLYPEGGAIAHQVIVHPPGGIVGGDRLEVTLTLQPQTHAVLTTPGATRFYRSDGRGATQSVQARIGHGARLEWLPLETIVHSGCIAENRIHFELDDGAEMIGWDVVALGLPAADETFTSGRFAQQLHWPGHWLERGVIDGSDTRLLHSPLGLNGHTAWLTMWFAAGDLLDAARAEALLDAARSDASCRPAHEVADSGAPDSAAPIAGATCLQQRVVLLRALANRTEPLMALAQAVRARWRAAAWALPDTRPRVWRT